MLTKTVECPICHEPYKIDMTPNIVEDQSACPECIAKAGKKSDWKTKIINK